MNNIIKKSSMIEQKIILNRMRAKMPDVLRRKYSEIMVDNVSLTVYEIKG